MTRIAVISLLLVALLIFVACESRRNADPTATPLPSQSMPTTTTTPQVSPTPAPTAAPSPTPTLVPSTPTPTPQKQEPHIPIPTATPTPEPTPTSTPGPWGEPPPGDPTIDVETELKEIAAQVSEIRGLELLSDPPINLLTREELAVQVMEILAEEFPPEEAAVDQELYLALDFLDDDEDLFQMISNLYSEQVVGFYDSDDEEMFVSSNNLELDPNTKTIFAHELTHALQDQHFDLDLFLPDGGDNDDLDRAKLALVEGDASLASSAYAVEHFTAEELFQLGVVTGEFTAFRDAARILQEDLYFPYSRGIDFVITLFTGGGWEAVDRAFETPPQSTEQVMHPEKYLEGDSPIIVPIPELTEALGEAWTLLDTGVIGEFVLTVYLENQLTGVSASKAAEGWGGDRYSLLKNDSTGERLLVLLVAWDTETDAVQFFNAYLEYVDGKGDSQWPLILTGEDRLWWDAADNSVYLSRIEDQVLIVIGQSSEAVDTVLPSFSGF